ncbi:ribokinase [Halalkalibacter okhensis]|uniref:Ribokinase n=1 Tax=Halalkalibacter okhensis TaxID=333138 RepID=A0A0B0IDE0_9BACI|nr:ribokinase [Halalkalibacter okhensis]KHF38852.1 ribokinase [Halalkalibacter okhensis]
MSKKKITVIGSINMDLVTITNLRPQVGETVLGTSFSAIPGGKGANQAVAAARLGAGVTLIGCVGADAFGQELRSHLMNEGVSFCEVKNETKKHTGIASITISDHDNSIIVVPGANEEVTPTGIEPFNETIAASDIILLQLEIPIHTIEYVIKIASLYNVPVIVNPAPFQPLSMDTLEKVTYITPNEHEEKMLNEIVNMKEKVVVTKGSKGVSIWDNDQTMNIASYKVDVVDTTGAGDAFNGALAVALAEESSLKDACRFATAVGALAVTKLGAQSGMPTREEVETFLGTYEKGQETLT